MLALVILVMDVVLVAWEGWGELGEGVVFRALRDVVAVVSASLIDLGKGVMVFRGMGVDLEVGRAG